jgi:hypothetical protein
MGKCGLDYARWGRRQMKGEGLGQLQLTFCPFPPDRTRTMGQLFSSNRVYYVSLT